MGGWGDRKGVLVGAYLLSLELWGVGVFLFSHHCDRYSYCPFYAWIRASGAEPRFSVAGVVALSLLGSSCGLSSRVFGGFRLREAKVLMGLESRAQGLERPAAEVGERMHIIGLESQAAQTPDLQARKLWHFVFLACARLFFELTI